MGKRRRSPGVLQRAYGGRARTLADTILSLLPPPPPSAADCGCKGRRCLGCGEASFLLRDSDDSDYRRLLTDAYAVVALDAPLLPAYFPENRWGQRHIVKHSIETILSNSFEASNVMCNGYNKRECCSPVVDALCTSSWSCLLLRVGDGLMVHLLKYASIFLPLSNKNHLQVTGPPINESFQNWGTSVHRKPVSDSAPKCQKHTHMAYDSQSVGHQEKKDENERDTKSDSTILIEQPTCYVDKSASLVKERSRKRARPFSWLRRRKIKRFNISQEDTHNDSVSLNHPSMSLKETSRNENDTLFNNEACTVSQGNLPQTVVSCKEPENQHSFVNSQKLGMHCVHCFLLQAPKFHQIERQCIFYDSDVSRLLFPRNHILNRVKANDAGACSLLRHIFGFDKNGFGDSLRCAGSTGFCSLKSNCLYQSLLCLLKSLLRKAQRCQHLKLLDKHCSIPSLGPCVDEANSTYSNKEKFLPKKTSLSLFRVLTLRKKYVGVKSLNKCSSGKSNEQHSNQELELPTKYPQALSNQCTISELYCKHKQVESFIWAVCRSVIPLELLGDPSNWRVLRRNISKLVQLRRFEKFSPKQFMCKIKLTRIPLFGKVAESLCCAFDHCKKDACGECVNMVNRCNKAGDTKTVLRKLMFESWISWFFSCFLAPIIQANFYVTEHETGRQDVFYYKKPIWRKLMKDSIGFLKQKNYHWMGIRSVGRILSKRSFGFSRVRFLPKRNGLRPIANLKAPCKAWVSVQEQTSRIKGSGTNVQVGVCKRSKSHESKWKLVRFKSVNSALSDLFAVLKRVKYEHPEKLGSSVFDYNDIYRRLCPFLFSVKRRSVTMPPLFIVICDVSTAFDSVKHEKLLSVMKDVLCTDEYTLNRYAEVVCRNEALRVHYFPVSIDHSGGTDALERASVIPVHSAHGVLVDLVRRKQITRVTIYQMLEEHVKRNILQLGQDFFLQHVGIPQGSVLSSLLCSLYYGHMDRNVIFPFLEGAYDPCTVGCDSYLIPKDGDLGHGKGHRKLETVDMEETNAFNVENDLQNMHVNELNNRIVINEIPTSPEYMLLRLIDDFLFISTSKPQATSFFSRLQRGFSDYNCSMNSHKFSMNFDIENQSKLWAKRVYTGEDGQSFLPWGGLLINCDTFEIQADYARYWGVHMRSTLTVCNQVKLGSNLEKKLCDYMRPKCHPIFYDSNINSPAIVRLNAYQAFLLCAMKFHCYICCLPHSGSFSARYCLQIIRRSLSYMHNLLKKSMHGVELCSNLRPVLQMKKEELEWLGLSAYVRILTKKQSRYRELLSLLKSEIQKYDITKSTDMKYAVDDKHSSLFWKMKY